MSRKRRFRYVARSSRDSTAASCDNTPSFNHTLVVDIIAGVSGHVKAGTVVEVSQIVPCANGVWFKAMHDGVRFWFLSNGQSRSYKTIYQEEI